MVITCPEAMRMESSTPYPAPSTPFCSLDVTFLFSLLWLAFIIEGNVLITLVLVFWMYTI